jgi:hypothetical protein
VELSPEAQLLDQGSVALEIVLLEIVEEPAPPADELEQAPTRVVVLRVGAQVLRQVVDPAREERDLDRLRAARRSPASLPS